MKRTLIKSLFVGGTLGLFFAVSGVAHAAASPSFLLHFENGLNDTSGNRTTYKTFFFKGVEQPLMPTATTPKFGTKSLYSAGPTPTTGMTRYTNTNENFTFGNSAFTIDFWYKPVYLGGHELFKFQWDVDGGEWLAMNTSNTGEITTQLYDSVASMFPGGVATWPDPYFNRNILYNTTTATMTSGVWNHVALERRSSDGKFRVSVNGQTGTWFGINRGTGLDQIPNSAPITDTFSLPRFDNVSFGRFPLWNDATGVLDYTAAGYFDEFRITKTEALFASTPSGSTFTLPTSAASGVDDVATFDAQKDQDVVMYLKFDDTANPFKDSSKNNLQVDSSYSNIASRLPEYRTDDKKAGTGSVFFNGTSNQILPIRAANGSFDLNKTDYAVDFWIKPLNAVNNPTQSTWMSLWDLVPATSGNYVTFSRQYAYNKTLPLFSEHYSDKSFSTYVRAAFNDNGDYGRDLQNGVWQHVIVYYSVHKNGVGADYQKYADYNIAIDGKYFFRQTALRQEMPSFSDFVLAAGGGGSFQGFIDEVRITKGEAPWGMFDICGQAMVYDGNIDTCRQIDPNKYIRGGDIVATDIPTPTQVELGVTGAPAHDVTTDVDEAARAVVRTLVFKKADGVTRDFTNYYDSSAKIIKTDYWVEATGSKISKTIQYYTNGEIFKEKFYNKDGAVSDISIYYNGDNTTVGKLYKQIMYRNGTEFYSRYSSTGLLEYSHEVSGGVYAVSNTYTYDGSGNVQTKLRYNSATDYEYTVYERTGAIVTKMKQYTSLPAGTNNFTLTTTNYDPTSGVPTKQNKISASTLAGDLTSTKVRTDSYQNGKAFSALEYNFATSRIIAYSFVTDSSKPTFGRPDTETEYSLTTQDPISAIQYRYDSSGNPTSSQKLTNYSAATASYIRYEYYRNDKTIYSAYDKEVYPLGGFPKKFTVTSYGPGGLGEVLSVYTYEYHDRGSYTQPVKYAYKITGQWPNGDVYSVTNSNEDNGALISADYYDTNGVVNYHTLSTQVSASPLEYRYINYYVSGGTQIEANRYNMAIDATPINYGLYTYASRYKPETLVTNSTAQIEFGRLMLARYGVTLGGSEDTVMTTFINSVLTEYKAKLLAAAGLEQRKNILSNYSVMVLTPGISAIKNYYRNTDVTTDDAASHYVMAVQGKDANGNPFAGLYVTRPGEAAYTNPPVFVSMDINTPSGIVTNASNIAAFAVLPQKKEKWDSLATVSLPWGDNASGILSLYDVNANNGAGAWMTLAEFTKPDPTVNLLVDQMIEDLNSQGTTFDALKAKSDEDVIKAFYQYFFKRSLFTYYYDIGQTTQTVGETLARGGGDCEDFGVFGLSILRNLFLRLGKDAAANRLGMGSVGTDVTSTNIPLPNHGSMMYKSAGGQYYYIEASYLFQGRGRTEPFDETKILLPLNGQNMVVTAPPASASLPWNVRIFQFAPITSAPTVYLSSISYGTGNPPSVVTNVGEKFSRIGTYIKPYDPKIDAMTKKLLEFVPRVAEKDPLYIAKYIHDALYPQFEYTSDGATDTWTDVSVTLATVVDANGVITGKIKGDCEDLAFVEASVMTNAIQRLFLVQGMNPVSAQALAKNFVGLVGDLRTAGDLSSGHVVTAYVVPGEDSKTQSNSTIYRFDPQLPTVSSENYGTFSVKNTALFYSGAANASGFGFFDWNKVILSNKVTSQTSTTAGADGNPPSTFLGRLLNGIKNAVKEVVGSVAGLVTTSGLSGTTIAMNQPYARVEYQEGVDAPVVLVDSKPAPTMVFGGSRSQGGGSFTSDTGSRYNPTTNTITIYTPLVPQVYNAPAALCSVNTLCGNVTNKITTKPANSTFINSQICSSSVTSCGDTTYYTDWTCNPGFTKVGNECRSPVLPGFIDIGLRVVVNTATGPKVVGIAGESPGAVVSPLRIARDGLVYGVGLVRTTDPKASSVKVQVGSTAYAMRMLDTPVATIHGLDFANVYSALVNFIK